MLESAKQLFSPDPPKILYHYCSPEVFMKIIENKELWLTDAQKMNDSAEERWAKNLVWEACKSKSKSKAASEYFKGHYHREYKSNLMSVRKFLCCFSESEDSLSQWRAYSSDGAGYAIGFAVDELGVHCEMPKQSFVDDIKTLIKVCYKLEEQNYFINLSLNSDLEVDSEEKLKSPKVLAALSIAMKNFAFSEEKEWRIVYLPAIFEANLNDKDSECFFRQTPRGISPYFKHSFGVNAISNVVLGPTNQTTDSDVKLLLKKNSLDNVEISRSSATYRG